MKTPIYIKRAFIMLVFITITGCKDYLALDVPNHKITSKTVFSNDQTARAAMNGIYNQLFQASFSNGGVQSVTFLAALSADNFQLTSNINEILEFGRNNITAPNTFNYDLWAGAYNMIYMANAVLEGVRNSSSLSEETRKTLTGEAKFVRGFTYFYLTNLYKEVPLLLTTDYRKNAIASRNSRSELFEQIISDLEEARMLLGKEYLSQERTQANYYVVTALLARVYLYMEDWQKAAQYSSELITETGTYELLDDLNKVFLANSREAIWQISPIGWGNSFKHTREGNLFIHNATAHTPAALSDNFMNMWGNSDDKRLQYWVGNVHQEGESIYYPYKYKIQYDASSGEVTEYSMVLRLAEQYLIRAEARLKMGNITGTIADIDKLRQRAGIPLIALTNPGISKEALEDLLLTERRKELFAEWGHRWFYLRRTGNSNLLKAKNNADWKPSDNWYPIPQAERMKNPNLTQNSSY